MGSMCEIGGWVAFIYTGVLYVAIDPWLYSGGCIFVKLIRSVILAFILKALKIL